MIASENHEVVERHTYVLNLLHNREELYFVSPMMIDGATEVLRQMCDDRNIAFTNENIASLSDDEIDTFVSWMQ